jgi:hypothetical protein
MKKLMTISFAMMMGCAGAPANDDTLAEQVEDPSKADVIYPYGTWDGDEVQAGELDTVTLNDDKTYSCVTFLYCDNSHGLDCGHESGSFKFTHAGSTRYVKFYDETGTFVNRYAWKLSGDSLSLRASGDTVWMKMHRHVDYANEGEACGGFVAHPKQCADGLTCVYHNVPDLPGTCQK